MQLKKKKSTENGHVITCHLNNYFKTNYVYRNKLFEWAYRVLIQYKTPDLKLSNLLEKWQAGWKSHVHPLSLICCQTTPSNLIKQREL